MSIQIRDVRESDLDRVLELNNAAGPTILSLDRARIERFHRIAPYFRVAEIDGTIVGFLIALCPDADYQSPNFLWFKARYPSFVYIDRVVVSGDYRRHGIGRVFYADVLSFAEVRVPVLACEVFLEPRDDVSLLFHGTSGFQEVGQQGINGDHFRVSLLIKELPSFDYVQRTYLQAANYELPDWRWLPPRPPALAPSLLD